LFFINFLRNYNSSDQNEEQKIFGRYTYLILLSAFIGIFIGGKIFLDSSLNIFQTLGVNEVLIGIFVLAIGTSLPELITVIISYLKKKGSIGIGNVIGSNIMNILFVFLPGVIIVQLRGLEYSLKNIDVFHIYILILVTLMIALMAILRIQMRKIHSAFFLISYFLYLGYSFIL
jgi:cation:H+ antiporter